MKAMSKINSVLFFCTANICRSVAAEYIAKWLKETKFKEELKDVTFDSAGLYRYNEYSYEETGNYLKRKGIDLTDFKTKKITSELVEKHDLILGFEKNRHIRKLLRRFKTVKDLDKKTFLLLDFAGDSYNNREIEDPLNYPPEKYKETMEKIENGVVKTIENIIKINQT